MARTPARTIHARLRIAAHRDGTYDRLLHAQHGGCAICHRTPADISDATQKPLRKLDVDHDHRTHAIRGLLCRYCNLRLRKGLDADWLEGAADYLRRAA